MHICKGLPWVEESHKVDDFRSIIYGTTSSWSALRSIELVSPVPASTLGRPMRFRQPTTWSKSSVTYS